MAYKPNRELLAWASGFFDGEGSVHVCHSGAKKRTTPLPYPQVAISQSGSFGKEVLEKFKTAIGGHGKIYGPLKPAKNQRKVRYVWEANGFHKTQAIMALLWTQLGTVKRKKFAKVCSLYLKARR